MLRASSYRLIFLVPPDTKKDYRQFAEKDKVIFEEYKRPRRLEGKLGTFRLLNSFSQGTTFKLDTQTIRDKRRLLKEKGVVRFCLLRLLTWFVSFDVVSASLKKFDWWLFKKQWVKDLFATYRPSLIYSTDPLFFDEVYFLEYAKKNKIKIISQILSWDNLTNRGYLAVIPDKCIVWNDIMKDQLLSLYKYPAENIFVSGIPHFDRYFSELPVSKDAFFKQLGLDPQKRLITFFTGSPANYPSENDSIKKIITNLAALPGFFDQHQILLRLNPKDNVSRHADILNINGVFSQRIGVIDSRFRDNWNPKEHEIIELAATLQFSDVVVGMSSTICIEAAIYNTPQVVLDMDPRLHYFYEMNHFVPIIESGGVRLAMSAQGAVDLIVNYLHNKSLDSAGRHRIVREQCVFTDGQSSKRVGKFMLNIADRI